MIRVKYLREEDFHRLILAGHAGHAKHGDDIVCAGVSATVYNLLGWLENHSEELEHIQTSVDSGDVEIVCIGGENVATAFELTAIGLEQIAQRYPECVDIIIVGLAD